MTWVQTFTGLAFDLKNPRPELVCIEDIAHQQANQGRFMGATRAFYSNAQHCVLATQLVADPFKKQMLLHDSPEVYLGDWSRPLKVLMREAGVRQAMDKIYDSVAEVIGIKFGIELVDLPPAVKLADDIMLATEKRDLMAPEPQPWVALPEPRLEVIDPWAPERAELEFLRVWSVLNRERAAMT